MSASRMWFTFVPEIPTRARPAHHAGRARAETRTRTRGSPPRRSRSAPPPSPFGRFCPPGPRSRAGAAPVRLRDVTAAGPVAPYRLLAGPADADRRSCDRDRPRRPATSARPRPAAASRLSAKNAVRSMIGSRWWRSAVNRSFFLCFAACRTRSSACDTLSRSCARRVLCWLAFPLAPALGSTGSATGSLRLCSSAS